MYIQAGLTGQAESVEKGLNYESAATGAVIAKLWTSAPFLLCMPGL